MPGVVLYRKKLISDAFRDDDRDKKHNDSHASDETSSEDSTLRYDEETSLTDSEEDSDQEFISSSSASTTDDTLATHMKLVHIKSGGVADQGNHEITTAPLFVQAVCSSAFTQWGFLGADTAELAAARKKGHKADHDPRVFCNVAAPLSVFICGSQGSGKSHTLSVFLENYLAQSVTNQLPRPLTGIVFYYDSLTSDFSGTPCEASYLSSNPKISVRVLCSRTNISNIKRIYGGLPHVKVDTLRINESDLNTERMNVLMGVNKLQGSSGPPLYMSVIERILREMRELQQENGKPFNYRLFKERVKEAALTDAQLAPLQQRLETLESFMVDKQAKSYDIFVRGKKDKSFRAEERKVKKGPVLGNDWAPEPGQLTIVDLSCPCITPEMACSLFSICLSLFLERESDVGRFAALDEAHQFMTDSGECRSLTDGLLKTIRLQRHLGARVIISTQEPTISTALLDLCSITVVHRFTSPAWHQALVKHLAGASMAVDGIAADTGSDDDDNSKKKKKQVRGIRPVSFPSSKKLFEAVVGLATGEALVFAPKAIIGVKKAGKRREVPVYLGHGVLKLRIRKRVTEDGGQSVMAC